NEEEQDRAEQERAELGLDAPSGGGEGVGEKQRSADEDHREIGQLGNRPGAILLRVEDFIQGRTQPSEHTSREPQEQGRGEQRETAATGHQVAEGTLDEAETVTAGLVRLREEALQQLVDVQLVYGKLVLDQVGDDRHDERDE